MRLAVIISGFVAALAATPASAATVIVYTDPMTLERRTIVLESSGPDRAFVCMMPPGDAGCRQIPIKRGRR